MLKQLKLLHRGIFINLKRGKLLIMGLSLLTLAVLTNVEFIRADVTENSIAEIMGNGDVVAIKKIEFDENDQIIADSIQDINPNTKGVNLANGTYVINKGKGWVLNNDKSHVASGFANAGQTVSISKSVTASYEHTIMSGGSLEFDFSKVKLAIEVAYEHRIKESDSITTVFSMTAPSGKNLYLKTYNTYNRYDVVKVQNGAIIGHSITYEPDGSWAKYITYNSGETVDQNAFKEQFDRSVLGASSEISIDASGYSEE